MQAKNQLNQFKRIQKHYQMELDALTAELRKLNLRMSERKTELELLESEMENAQQPHGELVSIVNCVAGAAHLKLIGVKWNEKSQEHSQAKSEFETQRLLVQKQLSRIESMDRLIEQKSKLVEAYVLKQEQLIADERYLQCADGGMDIAPPETSS